MKKSTKLNSLQCILNVIHNNRYKSPLDKQKKCQEAERAKFEYPYDH